VLAPEAFVRITAPFASKVEAVYAIFEPLVMGNTKSVSIGTRFGMASAGLAMGEAHPLTGVGLGQFGFYAYNFTPLWGLNGETVDWLSNDKNAWPSTSNLYARLIGEMGLLACAVYCALRLVLLTLIGQRLLRKDSVTWSRDLCVFVGMIALVAFDFHRDSFINLDAWVLLGMAMACIQTERGASFVRNPAMAVSSQTLKRIFWSVGTASFALVLVMILVTPATYLASATLAPKDKDVMIGLDDLADGASFNIAPRMSGTYRFQQFRMYWASTTVSARIVADHPDLVRAVLGERSVEPISLATYIENNVTVLLADKQTTLTLQYRNSDPMLARKFLATAIDETDELVLEAAKQTGQQASQLSRITLASNLDITARQTLLRQAAAQELQSEFNTAGTNASFDYVEHPGILHEFQSPDPQSTILFALGLALSVGAGTTVFYLLWLGTQLPLPLRTNLFVQ